jgi:hypothetical protein
MVFKNKNTTKKERVDAHLVHRLLYHYGHPWHIRDHIPRLRDVMQQPLLLLNSLRDVHLLRQ